MIPHDMASKYVFARQAVLLRFTKNNFRQKTAIELNNYMGRNTFCEATGKI